ncbi:hypothetical protein [Paucisalibacillus sp. EB02]|uniref:hypothetical protein n=1 Tax=Paucisalibacillus sp. EB02 TaxID=1347087 RepID=UPI0004B5AEBE|nr:hypothetical protein [Paucisalibacillus sp. EB02]
MEDMKPESNDQAKELRELLQEVNNNSVEEKNQSLDDQHNYLDETVNLITSEDKTLNVLNLPPRKVVHSQKKNRTHVKISKPFIRLAIVVILLLTVIGLLFFYGDVLKSL